MKRLKNLRMLLWLAAIMQLAVPAWAQVPRGSISGRIVFEETGAGLSGVTVVAFFVDSKAGPMAAGSTLSADNGSYTISGLRDGPYLICSQAPGSDLLAPCRWAATPVTATVSGGKATLNVDQSIQRGRRIEVEVKDTGETLDKNEVKRSGVSLLVGVWGGSGFHRARLEHKDKKTRTYAIVIPFDTDVGLEVKGRKLSVADDKGREKQEDDAPERIREPRGASRDPKKFTIDVKGTKP